MSSIYNHASLRVTRDILSEIFPDKHITESPVEFRIGKNGAIVVNKETSQVYNFTNGEGGNLASIYAKSNNVSYNEAYQTLAKKQGIQPIVHTSRVVKPKSDEDKKSYALKLYRQSVSIKGTLAEKYLISRCLNPMFFPKDFRYSEDNKCLVIPFKKFINGKLEDIAIHRIFLNDDATKKEKRSYAAIKGAGLWLSDPKLLRRKLFISEGPEDALSIYQENYGISIVATTGASHLPNFEIPPNVNSVTLLRDNDDASERFSKKFCELYQGKLELLEFFPDPEFKDFNEQLQHKRNSLMGALYDH